MKILVVIAMEEETQPVIAELGVVLSEIQIKSCIAAAIYF